MIIEWLGGCEGKLRLCLFLLGCGINGPKTLLSIAVRDAVSKDILGAAGGVFGLVGQVDNLMLLHPLTYPLTQRLFTALNTSTNTSSHAFDGTGWCICISVWFRTCITITRME